LCSHAAEWTTANLFPGRGARLILALVNRDRGYRGAEGGAGDEQGRASSALAIRISMRQSIRVRRTVRHRASCTIAIISAANCSVSLLDSAEFCLAQNQCNIAFTKLAR
jgi:hypothetical protein